MGQKPHDYTGRTFGALFVMHQVEGRSKAGDLLWQCSCDCGGSVIRRSGYLRLVKRPGCDVCADARRSEGRASHRELIGIRGQQPRLYTIWNNMKIRCTKPEGRNWPRYGGRGVKVCPSWADFGGFKRWAYANGYAENLTIDRVCSSGDYEPGNCEWVTRGENSRRMWAERTPEERTAEGHKRYATTKDRLAKAAVIASFDLGQHLPIEFMWGA